MKLKLSYETRFLIRMHQEEALHLACRAVCKLCGLHGRPHSEQGICLATPIRKIRLPLIPKELNFTKWTQQHLETIRNRKGS